MGVFGLGNIVSIYAAFKTGIVYTGLGAGFLYYKSEADDTSISVLEPVVMVMTKPLKKVLILRVRVGLDIIFEKRYGLRAYTATISPDVLLIWKGIYAGISIPVIIGKEGAGLAFSIGAGYMFSF